MVAGAYWKQ